VVASRVDAVCTLTATVSEKAKAFLPLELYAVSVSPSPNAHIFAVLKTDREADAKGVKDGLYGKDVMVWGGNGGSKRRFGSCPRSRRSAEYQLGNGKRSSLATPQHLPRLIPREAETAVLAAAEAAIGSGTVNLVQRVVYCAALISALRPRRCRTRDSSCTRPRQTRTTRLASCSNAGSSAKKQWWRGTTRRCCTTRLSSDLQRWRCTTSVVACRVFGVLQMPVMSRTGRADVQRDYYLTCSPRCAREIVEWLLT
jgi:hypothetical protein